MSDTTYHHRSVSNPSSDWGGALVYRGLFAAVFGGSLLALACSRCIGQGPSGSIWLAAKQGAHAAAGYALKH